MFFNDYFRYELNSFIIVLSYDFDNLNDYIFIIELIKYFIKTIERQHLEISSRKLKFNFKL
jgi:hypothetical protein